MPHLMIESQQMPYGQVEIPSGCMHPNMAGDSLHGDSSVRMVFLNARLRLHQHQNDPKVRILDHGLGVASVLPGRFAFQLFNLGVQIEFQKYTGSGLYRSLRSSARCLRLTDFHGLVVSLCFRAAASRPASDQNYSRRLNNVPGVSQKRRKILMKPRRVVRPPPSWSMMPTARSAVSPPEVTATRSPYLP